MGNTLRNRLWTVLRGLLILSVAALGACQTVTPKNYALPNITMYENDVDKTCSFALYDGGSIDFTQSGQCKNDEYYSFSISGAHEGMEIEFHDEPSCNGSQPFAKYVVSFRTGGELTGNVAKTGVGLSQDKSVGTRLNDGDGKDVLIANGYKSGTLGGKVSCVRVHKLLPEGPYRLRSVRYPDKCLTGGVTDTSPMRVMPCTDGEVKQSFFELNNPERSVYAGWVPRGAPYVPVLRLTHNPALGRYDAVVALPGSVPPWFDYNASTKVLSANGICIWPSARSNGDAVVTNCSPSLTDEKWNKEPIARAHEK
ncbi:hypothetical protein [Pandoraea sp. PE-S2R-1]|uniref:hypothetical protein n=1 Tax=Pandoraea sp. PE-S2R-1 TaxID=1986994 RepID=UPI0011323121|nr:hypothetical protein [Pandoraea sp. PE-S2R-1]